MGVNIRKSGGKGVVPSGRTCRGPHSSPTISVTFAEKAAYPLDRLVVVSDDSLIYTVDRPVSLRHALKHILGHACIHTSSGRPEDYMSDYARLPYYTCDANSGIIDDCHTRQFPAIPSSRPSMTHHVCVYAVWYDDGTSIFVWTHQSDGAPC